MSVPSYDDLYNPLLEAFHKLGGSASTQELEDKVAELLELSDRDINEIHRGSRTKLNYRLAWSRNYLKRFGLLENSSRGVWALTKKGVAYNDVDKKEVNHFVKQLDKIVPTENIDNTLQIIDGEKIEWQEKMLDTLKKLKPDEFERLCQRILREAGFIKVKITGKSGDEGIDGRGIVKIGGLLSYHVIFQCKRYKGNVSSKDIREFKGTMVGRADKGLFITTGNYTRDARYEAERDGSVQIDLVDGYELVEKMKELGLGVIVKSEEVVNVDDDWFKSF